MTEPTTDTPQRKKHRGRRIDTDGDTWMPRFEFAEELVITDRTAQELNLPTTYIGNVAYVPRNGSLKIITAKAQRRNQPRQRRGRARR